MTMNRKNVNLIVRSRRVPVRIDDVSVVQPLPVGTLASMKERVVIYGYVLDDEQKLALREAREFARLSGLPLIVTDLTRETALKRILRRVRGAKAPSLIMPGLGCIPSSASKPATGGVTCYGE